MKNRNGEKIEADLKKHPFFKGLLAKYIKEILPCASEVVFKTGEMVFREGEKADTFYILINGKIAVETAASPRGSITIQTISGGDVLGWSWLIPPHEWRFSARVIESIQGIALDAKSLRVKCEKDYKFGYELLMRSAHVLATRLEHARNQLMEQSGILVNSLSQHDIKK